MVREALDAFTKEGTISGLSRGYGPALLHGHFILIVHVGISEAICGRNERGTNAQAQAPGSARIFLRFIFRFYSCG